MISAHPIRIVPPMLLGMMFLAACGVETEEADPTNVAIARFYLDLAEARCERYASCCTAEEQGALRAETPALGTPEACNRHFIEELDRLFRDVEDAREAGTVGFDATLVDACLQATRSCAATDVCARVITGMRGDGVPCESDVECAGGHCVGVVDGLCSSGGAGSLCDYDEECQQGHYCAFRIDMCLAKLGDGQLCNLDQECLSGFCEYDDSLFDFVCVGSVPPPGSESVTLDRCDGA